MFPGSPGKKLGARWPIWAFGPLGRTPEPHCIGVSVAATLGDWLSSLVFHGHILDPKQIFCVAHVRTDYKLN